MPPSSRLFAFSLLALAVTGCQAAVITAPGYQDPVEPIGEDAEAQFVMEVQPLLEQRCSSCHMSGVGAPMFLDAADSYSSVLAYPGLVRAGQPDNSTLLTKGRHDGGAWTPAQAATIADWIEAEASTEPVEPVEPGPTTESATIDITPGQSHELPLDAVGLAGTTLSFNAMNSSSGLLLTEIAVRTASEIAISQPRFVVYDQNGNRVVPDIRSFAGDAELRFPSGRTMDITSAWPITGFPEGGRLAVEFESASIPQ